MVYTLKCGQVKVRLEGVGADAVALALNPRSIVPRSVGPRHGAVTPG